MGVVLGPHAIQRPAGFAFRLRGLGRLVPCLLRALPGVGEVRRGFDQTVLVLLKLDEEIAKADQRIDVSQRSNGVIGVRAGGADFVQVLLRRLPAFRGGGEICMRGGKLTQQVLAPEEGFDVAQPAALLCRLTKRGFVPFGRLDRLIESQPLRVDTPTLLG